MQFRLETFVNSYLPVGANRVDAVVSVTADGDAAAGSGGSLTSLSGAIIGIIVDISGSMQGDRMLAAKHAVRKAIELLDENTMFFIVAFSGSATLISPLHLATSENKYLADAQVQRLEAGGGTCMSSALLAAYQEFSKRPELLHYALFLTDGKNSDDDRAGLESALIKCEGAFQCDCRGVGTDWQPRELQKISSKLLGSAMIIAQPAGIEADFRAAIQAAMARSVGGVRLRLWTPKTAKVIACKQVSPEIVVLTDRSTQVDAQTLDFPTGAWGKESRDYYVAFEIASGDLGDEVLACRPSIVYSENGQDVKSPAPPIVATWTDDEALSARINDHVAHYTGQEELAQSIQQGLEARDRGDIDAATHMLGKAAKLAAESGNEDTFRKLAKVVDVVDAAQGTVRLKAHVDKADEMDLDLSSTRTSRAHR
jgi:Mg-chelatase subunit ChlD